MREKWYGMRDQQILILCASARQRQPDRRSRGAPCQLGAPHLRPGKRTYSDSWKPTRRIEAIEPPCREETGRVHHGHAPRRGMPALLSSTRSLERHEAPRRPGWPPRGPSSRARRTRSFRQQCWHNPSGRYRDACDSRGAAPQGDDRLDRSHDFCLSVAGVVVADSHSAEDAGSERRRSSNPSSKGTPNTKQERDNQEQQLRQEQRRRRQQREDPEQAAKADPVFTFTPTNWDLTLFFQGVLRPFLIES